MGQALADFDNLQAGVVRVPELAFRDPGQGARVVSFHRFRFKSLCHVAGTEEQTACQRHCAGFRLFPAGFAQELLNHPYARATFARRQRPAATYPEGNAFP